MNTDLRYTPRRHWRTSAYGCLWSVVLAVLVAWTLPGGAVAQTASSAEPPPATPLKVATYACPPFAMRAADGTWSGLSILLWEEIAERLERPFEYEELPLDELLAAAEEGRIDVGVSCISITQDRETRVDFSHSMHETHLAIAVQDQSIGTAIVNFFTYSETLFWLGVLVLVASLVGGIYFFLEHRVNPKMYSRGTMAGRVVEGFLLGLLSITRGPVNYYEFKTLAGRVMTVFLAVATTLFVASFTAVLASAFTLDRLRSNITSPADLSGLRVGVKAAATSEAYLDRMGIRYRTYEDVTDILDALDAGFLDAAVADDPVLRFEIKRAQESGRYANLAVLPYRFERQNYGLVLPEDPDFHEEVDRALLEVRDSDLWSSQLGRYLGTVQ